MAPALPAGETFGWGTGAVSAEEDGMVIGTTLGAAAPPGSGSAGTSISVDWWVWAAFVAFVLAMLALDLFVLHREAHRASTKEAAAWSAVWVTLGLVFAAVLWWWQGAAVAGEYLAGYLLEKSLSVDNIFVFVLIFSYFSVPAAFQHRVLVWGVIGALVMRATFIAAGAALLERFDWVMYVFGAFLLFTAFRMARHREVEVHPDRNPVLRLVRKFVPMTSGYDTQKIFVRRGGKRLATPLFAVLVLIETTDVIFAVDSIPAIFAITTNTFVVFTSNVFAILGVRALYFLLARMVGRFRYLKVGLAAILGIVGLKMMLSEVYHPPIWLSLGVIAVILAVSVVASLRATVGVADVPEQVRARGRGLEELAAERVRDDAKGE